MTDLVFHRAEKYIQEDLEYYFSGERDMHSQVKPGENIYSFTADSKHFNIDYDDGKIGNFFFPFAPGSLDRIYIGISFPLFANNWGAAFLRHLMTLVKPDGCVVLPVYPEMQASEKNYWARSILENIFISRSRWKGMSNIWAENDGVMSMRIGRKPPPEIDSTANFLLRQAGQATTRHIITSRNDSVSDTLFNLQHSHWLNMQTSAIVERIIQDQFGRKGDVQLCVAGSSENNTALATELTLSPYINVKAATAHQSEASPAYQSDEIEAYHSRALAGRLSIQNLESAINSDNQVVTLIDSLGDTNKKQQASLLSTAWESLVSGGILIVNENPIRRGALPPEAISELLASFGEAKYYSAIAASEHKADVEISHYSLLIEQELREENETKEGVYWVIEK